MFRGTQIDGLSRCRGVRIIAVLRICDGRIVIGGGNRLFTQGHANEMCKPRNNLTHRSSRQYHEPHDEESQNNEPLHKYYALHERSKKRTNGATPGPDGLKTARKTGVSGVHREEKRRCNKDEQQAERDSISAANIIRRTENAPCQDKAQNRYQNSTLTENAAQHGVPCRDWGMDNDRCGYDAPAIPFDPSRNNAEKQNEERSTIAACLWI